MDFGSVEEQLKFLTRSREFLIGCMFFFFFLNSSACNTSPTWFPASDWLPMVFRNCRGKWQAKRAWNSSNSNCFFYQWWKIKFFWRKQAWIFGKELNFNLKGIQSISTRMCTKNTCQTWGGDSARAKKFKTWGHVESLRLRWGRKLNIDVCNLFICCL